MRIRWFRTEYQRKKDRENWHLKYVMWPRHMPDRFGEARDVRCFEYVQRVRAGSGNYEYKPFVIKS